MTSQTLPSLSFEDDKGHSDQQSRESDKTFQSQVDLFVAQLRQDLEDSEERFQKRIDDHRQAFEAKLKEDDEKWLKHLDGINSTSEAKPEEYDEKSSPPARKVKSTLLKSYDDLENRLQRISDEMPRLRHLLTEVKTDNARIGDEIEAITVRLERLERMFVRKNQMHQGWLWK